MFKDICGGGKGSSSSGSTYDPQISAAAASSAATAARAEQFSESYFTNTISPLLKQQADASAAAQQKLGALYDVNTSQMQLALNRYKQYGIPAENRYYDMVSQYSEPQEFERQAELAKGDFATAQQAQQGQMDRRMAAMGIDPTSPAAIAAASDRAVMGAAAQANAMNRARNAARTLGMQLTSDAANFGRGGQSGILQFGAGAASNAAGAFGVANQALATGAQAGQGVMQGYQTALSGYGNIMDNYARLGSSDIAAQAQINSQPSGIGQFLGTAAGIGASFIPGFGMSDARAKEDVRVIGVLPSGVEVVRFRYKPEFEPDKPGDYIGVIAQQVAPIIPEAVSADEDGLLYVDNSKVY
jgi:hypothetical protein